MSDEQKHVRVESGGTGHTTRVWLDGQPRGDLKSFKYECQHDGLATLTLELYTIKKDLVIDGKATVKIVEVEKPEESTPA